MTENSQENPVIVKLEGVTKVYQQGEVQVHALRGIDLEVRAGECLALTGPSGSGKTTALNMIGGLDEATAGSVIVAGKDMSKLSRAERSALRRDRIGFVFQAYNLIPVLTAYENAEMVLRLQGAPEAQRKKKVMDILEAVGLEGMEANVDSATAEMLLDTMETLNRERGATFIFSTHDPRVMKRARKIVHMVDGKIDSITEK
jgi:putative ABC transport system ATP-binding protein